MPSTVVLTTPILESTSGLYTFVLVDEVGDSVPANTLTAMTLTYYDRETNQVINGRLHQDVLNTNNVSVATAVVPPVVTLVSWDIQLLDSILVDARRELEQHIALFQWTWYGGQKASAHEVQFAIEALTYVP
jgi:hypothetical protein